MKKIKVFIIDDHKIVREGIISFTLGQEEIVIVGDTGDGNDLAPLLDELSPDVVVMDVWLPGKNGIELTKFISENYPNISVLVLSAIEDEKLILESIEAGASAFLHKDCEEEEFLLAIKKVYDHEEYFNQKVLKIIQQKYLSNIRKKPELKMPDHQILTKRELEVIKLVSDGYRIKSIADTLFISQRTVETHKKNIHIKLKLDSTAELVKYAIKNKIVEL